MMAELEEEWELVFHEQEDGRRVSRLPSGKVVLVDLSERDRVQDGDQWQVRVMHKEAYAIAHLVELVTEDPDPEAPPRRLDGPEDPVEEEMLDVVVRTRTPDTETRREGDSWATRPADVIRPGERVAVFVDGSSADQICRDAGYWFDYVRLLAWGRGAGTMHGGYYYATDRRMDAESQQQRFLDLLTHNSFIVHVKPPRREGRANVAVEMAVDALGCADSFDVAWIVGGDSDLSRLVEALRAKGKRVYVLCSGGIMNRELAAVVNKPIFNLEDHREALERRNTAPATRTWESKDEEE